MVATLGLVSTVSLNAMALASAELYHTEANLYGRFEARIRFAAGDGVVSSFFLWKEGSEKSVAYWNELDFEKIGADCRMQTNSIYGQPSANHEQRHQLSGTCSGYHDYRIEWTPTYIAWVVDGQELRRDTGAAASAYSENAKDGMTFHFNIWPGTQDFGGNIKNTTLPVYQHISWVRYSAYNNGNFELKWQQDFQCPDLPEGWQLGDWDSPMGQSTHNPENVGTVDGIGVLALTEDNATGTLGTPPVDSNAGGSSGNGCGGAGGSGGASSGGSSSRRSTSAGGSTAAGDSSAAGGSPAVGGSSVAGGSTSAGGSSAVGGRGGSSANTSTGGNSAGQGGNSSHGGAKGGSNSSGDTTGSGGQSASSNSSGGSSASGGSSSSAASSSSSGGASGGKSSSSSSARGGSSSSSGSSAKGGSSATSGGKSSSSESSESAGDGGCTCRLGQSQHAAAPFAILSLLVLSLICRIRRKGV